MQLLAWQAPSVFEWMFDSPFSPFRAIAGDNAEIRAMINRGEHISDLDKSCVMLHSLDVAIVASVLTGTLGIMLAAVRGNCTIGIALLSFFYIAILTRKQRKKYIRGSKGTNNDVSNNEESNNDESNKGASPVRRQSSIEEALLIDPSRPTDIADGIPQNQENENDDKVPVGQEISNSANLLLPQNETSISVNEGPAFGTRLRTARQGRVRQERAVRRRSQPWPSIHYQNSE